MACGNHCRQCCTDPSAVIVKLRTHIGILAASTASISASDWNVQ